MNNFVVTNFGFIKSCIFNKESLKFEIEYTDKIRYAMAFNGKGAKTFMAKHDIIGFILCAVKPIHRFSVDGM